MKLSNEQLKKIYFGAYEFVETDGYLRAYQFNEKQHEFQISLVVKFTVAIL